MHTLIYGRDDDTRSALTHALRARDHDTHVVDDAEDAWAAFRTYAPSMIILNALNARGLAFSRRVRAHAGDAPIILVTEQACSQDSRQELLDASIDDCICGSLDEQHLDRRLAFLERRVTRRLDRLHAEQRLTVQYAIAQVLTDSETLEEATPDVLKIICTELNWEWGELWVPDDDEETLRCVEIWSHSDISVPRFEAATHDITFAPGVGLPGAVWAEGEPRWIPDVTRHNNFVRADEAAEADMHGAFAFPIQLEGEVWGVMTFVSREIREPDERLVQAFAVVGNQIGQFAERRWTERELRRSRDRLAQAQKIANLGSWEYDIQSEEIAWSDQMYRIHGEPADPPTVEKAMRFFPPNVRDSLARVVEGEDVDDATFAAEHQLQTPDGTEQWVFARAEVVRAPDGRPSRLVGTVLDITPLKQMKQALRESEAKAQAIVATTVDGIITIDERGHIESFNEAAEAIFGYEESEVIGRNVKMLMPNPHREEHDDYLKRYHQTGEARIIGIGREVRGKRKDGSTFPLDLAVSEVQLGDRRLFTGIVRDITERRRLEKEVLNVAEQERRRIGQDLHDGLGQMLTGIGLLSQNLAQRLANRDLPEADDASEITELLREADQQARDLAHGLTPVDLEASGLGAALTRIATSAERLFDVECTVNEVGVTHIRNSTTAAHLYRIAQEAVSNAARHGAADHVRISLASGPEHVRLRIQDDGVGFPDEIGDEGMGVRIMNYRARIIGGTLEITTGRGEGTTVTCTIPRSTGDIASASDTIHHQDASSHA